MSWQVAGSAVAQAVSTSVPRGGQVWPSARSSVRPCRMEPSSSSARPTRCATSTSACAATRALTVVANRGLAGIDGCLSTAIGLALTTDAPSYAWVGDLTFLHDSNALAIGPDEPRPDLTILVTNDRGGGIFRTLEHGAPERADDFGRIFATPTGTDFGALCRAHGIRHVLAHDARSGSRSAVRDTRRDHRRRGADRRGVAPRRARAVAPDRPRRPGDFGVSRPLARMTPVTTPTRTDVLVVGAGPPVPLRRPGRLAPDATWCSPTPPSSRATRPAVTG